MYLINFASFSQKVFKARNYLKCTYSKWLGDLSISLILDSIFHTIAQFLLVIIPDFFANWVITNPD